LEAHGVDSETCFRIGMMLGEQYGAGDLSDLQEKFKKKLSRRKVDRDKLSSGL